MKSILAIEHAYFGFTTKEKVQELIKRAQEQGLRFQQLDFHPSQPDGNNFAVLIETRPQQPSR